ncbi:hypothetical protein [Pontibacter sp. H249]|uniref:hypothetical protein n=1 Tax=Pontibacter sp. H249 TaxID=3133420 RepID=UPI0030C59DC6
MKIGSTCLLILSLTLASCQQENEGAKEGNLAETHPKLEEQLENRTVSEPITEGRNPDLYQRYRITMDEYQNSRAYDVGNMYRGRLAPLDEKSHTDAATYRTALREGMKQGVNFAGKYTVVTIGCGTSCQRHYVINRENGKILDEMQSSVGAKYNANSHLFIVNPPDSTINYQECSNCTPEAYTFENGKFRKVSQD